jgi:hypothetical protein
MSGSVDFDLPPRPPPLRRSGAGAAAASLDMSMESVKTILHAFVYPKDGNVTFRLGENKADIESFNGGAFIGMYIKNADFFQFVKNSGFFQKIKRLYPYTKMSLEIFHVRPTVRINVDCMRNATGKNVSTDAFLRSAQHVIEKSAATSPIYVELVVTVDTDPEADGVALYTTLTFLFQLYVGWIFYIFKREDGPTPIVGGFTETLQDIEYALQAQDMPRFLSNLPLSIRELWDYMNYSRVEHSIDEREVMELLHRVADMDGLNTEHLLERIIVSPDTRHPFEYWRAFSNFEPLTYPPRLYVAPVVEPATPTVDPDLLREYRAKEALAFRRVIPSSDLAHLRTELAEQERQAGVRAADSAIHRLPDKGGIANSLGGRMYIHHRKKRSSTPKRGLSRHRKKRSSTPKRVSNRHRKKRSFTPKRKIRSARQK